MRLTSGLSCAVIYLFFGYFSKPAWLSAANSCISGEVSFSSLCISMGVTYPNYPPSLAELTEFRNRILDPSVYTWVKIGSDQWGRPTEIGTIYRNSANGAAFEAKRDPGSPDGMMEYFRMCRISPFTFPGGQNSRNPINGRPILHITRVAYSDSLESFADAPVLRPNATIPVPDAPVDIGPKTEAMRPFNSKYCTGVLAAVIVVAAVANKAKSDWGKLSLRTMIADASQKTSKFLAGNLIVMGVSLENGSIECTGESLWFECPLWPPWLVRILVYLLSVFNLE